MLRWVGVCLLYAGLGILFYMLDYAITQPHPVYCSGESWIKFAWAEALQVAWFSGASMAAIILVHLLVQHRYTTGAPFDTAFFPTPNGLQASFKARWPRLLLIATLLSLMGYCCLVAVWMWEARQRPHGLLWGPHWLFVLCWVMWCMSWVADSLTRIKRSTATAAILYTVWIGLWAFGFGSGILDE